MNETHTAKEITAALLDALKHQGLCLKEALQMIEKGEENGRDHPCTHGYHSGG